MAFRCELGPEVLERSWDPVSRRDAAQHGRSLLNKQAGPNTERATRPRPSECEPAPVLSKPTTGDRADTQHHSPEGHAQSNGRN